MITGAIDAVAFGGEGILRHEGIVVFVPFAVPADRVEVEVTEVKKSFARGKVVKLLKPSGARIEPKCGHFGVCGGCQLQNLPYEQQLAIKHDFVTQSLSRIGKIKDVAVNPVIGTKAQWDYRRVVKLHFSFAHDNLTLGFVNQSSDALVNVKNCPIFKNDPSLWDSLHAYLLRCIENSPISSGTLSLFKNSERFVGHLKLEFGFVASVLQGAQPLPDFFQGFVISFNSDHHSIGDTSLKLAEQGRDFTYTVHSFVQNHEEQSAKINSHISELVAKRGAKSVFDLYCGFGVNAILLAKSGAQVTAVESNPDSIRLAKQNADLNGAVVDFVCDDVARFIKNGIAKNKPDLVIVNPPRTGLSPSVAKALSASDCPDIIYVSCMPQTLARDLAVLISGGYSISECQPYDMFPQTTHVETLVSLRRLRV